jgi:hypothetical protein
MPSLFYKAMFDRRFPLPFVFIEHVNSKLEELGEEGDEAVEAMLVQSISFCMGIDKVTKEDIEYTSQRLEEASFASPIDKKGEGGPTVKKSFATSFSEWVTGLQPEDLCLVIAGFDYGRAKQMYTEVDYEDVVNMSAIWMDREWEYIKVGYESVVYGFGGGYDDKATHAATVDVSAEDHTQGKAIDRAILDSVKF